MTRRILSTLAIVLSLASSAQAAESPDAFRDAVSFAERLGNRLYAQFKAMDSAPPNDADRRVADAALAAASDKCDTKYVPIVVPGVETGSTGVTVYLIALANEPNTVMWGRHFRVDIDPETLRVLSVTPLARGCSSRRLDAGPGSKIVSMTVTHVVSNSPVETHVFLSLLHNLPLLVLVAKSGMVWKVTDGRISFFEQLRPR